MHNEEITVIDNFLPPDYFKRVQEFVLGPLFDWYYLEDLTFLVPRDAQTDDQSLKTFGYWHLFVRNGVWRKDAELLGEMFEMTAALRPEIDEVVKSRADMLTNNGPSRMLPPHTDSDDRHTASIFYLADSDGETVLYNERYEGTGPTPETLTERTRVAPRANRIVIFDGYYVHTGHSPGRNSRRVLINTNFSQK